MFLNAVSREPVQIAKTPGAASTPEKLMALREHRRLLAELIGSPMAIEPAKPFEPRPRSEGLHEVATA